MKTKYLLITLLTLAGVALMPFNAKADPVCGNNLKEAPEECDGGLGCGKDCHFIKDFLPPTVAPTNPREATFPVVAMPINPGVVDLPPPPPSLPPAVMRDCGNGIIETGEECDDGNKVDGDGCTANCELEPSVHGCGDGVVDAWLGEECDDGNIDNGDGCSIVCKKEKTIIENPAPDGVFFEGSGCSLGSIASGKNTADLLAALLLALPALIRIKRKTH